MIRWGLRLFECDQDLFHIAEIRMGLEEIQDIKINAYDMVTRADASSPHKEARYKTDEYKKELEDLVSYCRNTLDSGLGDELLSTYRTTEDEFHGKYRLILVGAVMMRAGAVIKDDDLNHLREIVPQVWCRDGLRPTPRRDSGAISMEDLIEASLFDMGFRHPGKAQFLAALENYKPGVPRSFQEPSCYSCGKIAADTGEATLSRCAKCEGAWYCNTACQRAHWKNHKPACIPLEDRASLSL